MAGQQVDRSKAMVGMCMDDPLHEECRRLAAQPF
jgi:hypothetical protein